MIRAGARLHQAGCNGCIGMGQAPATGRNSLRTVPRGFPGRWGTREDSVFLCSPETAKASALEGRITDPRELDMPYPRVALPEKQRMNKAMLVAPLPAPEARSNELVKGPNIVTLPELEPLPDVLELPVLLAIGDDVSTDEILPAGSRILPYRSNIEKLADFAFEGIDPDYPERARRAGAPAVVAGRSYGQGSSREHATLVPRHLRLRLVVAASFARIHWQNLVNFGVLPLTFADRSDAERLKLGARLRITGLHDDLGRTKELTAELLDDDRRITLCPILSARQVELLCAGGIIESQQRRARR